MKEENNGCINLLLSIILYLLAFAIALFFFSAFPGAILPVLIYVLLKNLLSDK